MPKWHFVDDSSEGENWANNQSALNAHIDFVRNDDPQSRVYRVAVATPPWIRREIGAIENGSASAALLNVTLVVQGRSAKELREAISEALETIPVWRFARLVE